MALVVMKFGGTSVADADRIRTVADYVARAVRHGNQVVVAVSAMGKETDELLHLARQVSDTQPGREMDMLITAGERKAMALLCMALHDVGRPERQLHRQPGRHHHRHRAHQGQDPRGPRRPACGRRWPPVGSLWSAGPRASRPTGTSPFSAAAGRTPPRWPWPRPWAPTRARSTPTCPECSRPIRGWCPKPAGCGGSASRRCWRCARPAARSRPCARWSSLATTGCGFTCDRLSPGSRVPGSRRKTPKWSRPWCPRWSRTVPRPSSPSPASPTSRASRPGCSGPWPTGPSTST